MLHEVAPLLKYGKYCGILYSGCSGETPCDDLDACCMMHDQCVLDNNCEFNSSLITFFIQISCIFMPTIPHLFMLFIDKNII
ncbi:putative phospholipase A(2) [Lupinus albus]|uniref:Putative phospholipase A(2) n=1 Tax=Lupinus albus TaxID=3870 RepID=A0A6A4P548_LUPAL|nr:putative phospholipase A(2) [Lupinus albus]